MIKKSAQCLISIERIAAISIIQGIGPQKLLNSLFHLLSSFSSSLFSPNSDSLLVASSPLRPFIELFCADSTSLGSCFFSCDVPLLYRCFTFLGFSLAFLCVPLFIRCYINQTAHYSPYGNKKQYDYGYKRFFKF